MPKIAITTTSFGEGDAGIVSLLEKEGFEVVINPYGRKLKGEEVVELCKGAVGIIAGTESLDSEVFEKLDMLKVVSRCGAGISNVDMDAAKRSGIKVFNTPDAPTLAVAELTVGLILNLLRKVSQMDSAIRQGRWKKITGNLLSGKRVGIVGFGRIGKKVASLLKSFDCEICYFDPFVADAASGFRRLSKEDIFRWADIVSIHASTADKIVADRELGLMKKGAWLINVSRGELLDEQALYAYLKNGHLSGAAIDVFEAEPYNGPLKCLDNVILTPHIGSYALEARMAMEKEAAENLLKGLKSA